MSSALPLPRRTLAVPLAALALGAAGGTGAALIVAQGDTIIREATPAAQVRELPSVSAPVPERVTDLPRSAAFPVAKSPVPERVSGAQTSSLAGTTSHSTPPPDRISGSHIR